jgi:hypothetical protein
MMAVSQVTVSSVHRPVPLQLSMSNPVYTFISYSARILLLTSQHYFAIGYGSVTVYTLLFTFNKKTCYLILFERRCSQRSEPLDAIFQHVPVALQHEPA